MEWNWWGHGVGDGSSSEIDELQREALRRRRKRRRIATEEVVVMALAPEEAMVV